MPSLSISLEEDRWLMMITNKDFLYLVLIAVSWLLFYGMIAGLVWFGITARSESDRCMATYERYIKEVDEKCTIRLNGSRSEYNLTFPKDYFIRNSTTSGA